MKISKDSGNERFGIWEKNGNEKAPKKKPMATIRIR